MIKNKTKNILLSKHHFDCKSIASKARGLMFSKPKTLVFYFSKPEKVSLHMWFVFFKIDVLFLDESFKIVDIKKKFKPFSFYTTPKKVSYVIEFPLGKIKNSEVGDMIEIVYSQNL